MVMKKRALVSVSDKAGVTEFCAELTALGYEIISTGGTADALTKAGVKNISVSDITGFPECLDGRVKTLHPSVHAGLLAMRSNPEHMGQLAKLGINTIDIVVVNLYPFKATVLKPGATFADAVENIDIGGPTMLRSAAKNYQDVAVIVDPSDYGTVIEKLKSSGVDLEFKKLLMYKVYQHTAVYDTLIADYLRKNIGIKFPEQVTFAFEKKQDLRYGENPHQDAAFYAEAIRQNVTLSEAVQLGGKELSYNNFNDANGALELLREFDECAVVAVKHSNPCGVAVGEGVFETYKRAYECDPVSIYGGIVAFNRKVDKRTAEELVKIFLEIVIAPEFDADALEVFKAKPNMRVLELKGLDSAKPAHAIDMKKLAGGVLLQDKDVSLYNSADFKVVTKKAPTAQQLKELDFAYRVVKHTKSNGIALSKDFSAVGIGGGQTNRIWAAQQAIEHAGEKAKGAVLASDAFFPFSDCVEVAAKGGISAIIQPGGSIRDEDSIKRCDELGIAMVFVGQRHFKH